MKDVFSLESEIAVVTGALGKLGSIWIETLLDAGASVFALDSPNAHPSDGFQKLQIRFGKACLQLDRSDVRDRGALETSCNTCKDTFGIPTILVNNAGIDQPPGNLGHGYRLEDIPFERIR